MGWKLVNDGHQELDSCAISVTSNRGSKYYNLSIGVHVLKAAGLANITTVDCFAGEDDHYGGIMLVFAREGRSLAVRADSSRSARLRIATRAWPFKEPDTHKTTIVRHTVTMHEGEPAIVLEMPAHYRDVEPADTNQPEGDEITIRLNPMLPEQRRILDGIEAKQSQDPEPEPAEENEDDDENTSTAGAGQAGFNRWMNRGITPDVPPESKPDEADPGTYAQERAEVAAAPAPKAKLPASVRHLWETLYRILPPEGRRITNMEIAMETDKGQGGLPNRLNDLEYRGLIERSGNTHNRVIRVLKRPPGVEDKSADDGADPEPEAPAQQPEPAADPVDELPGVDETVDGDQGEVAEVEHERPVSKSRPNTVFQKHNTEDRAKPIDIGPDTGDELQALTDGEERLLELMVEAHSWATWHGDTICRMMQVNDGDATFLRGQLLRKDYIERQGDIGRFEYRAIRNTDGQTLNVGHG